MQTSTLSPTLATYHIGGWRRYSFPSYSALMRYSIVDWEDLRQHAANSAAESVPQQRTPASGRRAPS